MAKRKREQGELEAADGKRHKKVKEEPSSPTDDIQALEKLAKKNAKRERRKKERKQNGKLKDEGEDSTPRAVDITRRIPLGTNNAKEKTSKEGKKEGQDSILKAISNPSKDSIRISRSKDKAPKKSKNDGISAWRVSEAIGGQMLDIDPIFTQDEEYILLAFNSAVHVYSVKTSLLVRRLRITRTDSLSALAFSPISSQHLCISTRSGVIEKWDWVEGTRLKSWNTSSPTYSLVAAGVGSTETTNDLVYTVDRKGENLWRITAHRLLGGQNATKTDCVTLLKRSQPLSSLKIMDDGKIIVATAGSHLIIGTCENPNNTPLRDVTYIWREMECPEWITCVDARIVNSGKAAKKPKLAKPTLQGAVHIVVGGLKGSIIMYEDILKKLMEKERNSKIQDTTNITANRTHWHRNSVLSVKWSADGNYIISGGQETVLVIWQIETGQKQFLPHLSSPIESVVVSPSGSSYAIRLADNSAMIISTSELQPTFSISGIQIPASRTVGITLPHVPTVDALSEDFISKQDIRYPAAVGLSGPGQLLLAVPPSISSRVRSLTSRNASYLQTFEIGSAHQTSRQALTRTKVTDLNIGPESNVIEEPNVTHMQISHDGQWLATIDEWMPPKRDLASLAFDKENVLEEQSSHQEVFLKLWSWNADMKIWELSSRIDSPHTPQNGNVYEQGMVLGLTSDPSGVGFATIGSDSTVRIWKPSVRSRYGSEVQGRDGKGLASWKCHSVTFLQASDQTETKLPGAKIAYSSDGSLLAAAYQSSTPSNIRIIDTYKGTIAHCHTGLYTGPLLGLAVLNKYLITLSHELRIWDMVNNEFSFSYNTVNSYGSSIAKQVVTTHLAVDHQQGTFAIALPTIDKSTKAKNLTSLIAIFNPENPTPFFATYIPTTTTTLLPATPRKGYYVIDSAAEVRTLTPTQTMPLDPLKALKDEKPLSRGLEDIYGNAKKPNNDDVESELTFERFVTVTHRGSRLPEDDAVVVTRDRLAEVFDVGPTHAMPPVTELFEQVASLFSPQVDP